MPGDEPSAAFGDAVVIVTLLAEGPPPDRGPLEREVWLDNVRFLAAEWTRRYGLPSSASTSQ